VNRETVVDEHGPLVSMGMPVYNGEAFIRLALDSLMAQEYKNFELIISDDASTDATQQICTEYAARYGQIKYFRNDVNIGMVRNYDRVLDLSVGEYFMWTAQDDVWEPSYVVTMVQLLSSQPTAVIAFSDHDNIDENGRQIKTYPHIFSLPANDVYTRLRKYVLQGEHLGRPNFFLGLMRRAAMCEAEGLKRWDDSLWGFDVVLVFRVLSLGNVALAPQLLFHKRVISSLSGHINPYASLGWRERFVVCENRLKERHNYYRAHNYIIDHIDSLIRWEKTKLKAVLYVRARFVYARYILAPCLVPLTHNPFRKLRKRSIRLPTA